MNDTIFDQTYIKPEVRCDFTIDEERKKLWSVQINLLTQLDRCCTENNIPYFAAYGTLLGAVRHHGYIPWDDDLDINMLRPDYMRFIQLAPKYFDHPYFFQNYYTDHNHGRVANFSRLRDERTTMIETEYRDCKDFHQGIFIDIFPLDIAPDPQSPGLSNSIIDIIREIWLCISEPRTILDDIINGYDPLSGKDTILDILGMPYEERFSLYENLLAENYDKSDYVIAFSCISKYSPSRKDWYAKASTIPFEYTTIPVPHNYDMVLKATFGDDYMTPKMIPNHHDTAIIDVSRPYTYYYA